MFFLLTVVLWITAVREAVSNYGIEDASLLEWQSEIEEWQSSVPKKPAFDINTAWLTVKSTVMDDIDLYLQIDQCFGCPLELEVIIPEDGNATVLLQSSYGNHIEMRGHGNQTQICGSHKAPLRERGDYWLIIQETEPLCQLVLANDPPNYNLPILWTFLCFVGLAVLWILMKTLYKKGVFDKCRPRHISQNISGLNIMVESTATLDRNSLSSIELSAANGGGHKPTDPITKSNPDAKTRLKSLDTFRGISLVVMIFVNYGGGKYWFFDHAIWNGLLVADLVFPWFVWIMGTAMVYSFRGMKRKETSKGKIALKIIERTIKLFFIGLFMGTKYSNDLSIVRIPGILQRLGVTYGVVALIHLIFGSSAATRQTQDRRMSWLRDVYLYWAEWLVQLALLGLHLGLTFGLPVPGCPTGYLGPGGLHDGGNNFNCSGGAAGYIDRIILTEDHIYQWPTSKTIYQGTQAFDPEGILGTLTSVFMCFIGLQAGKILVTFSSHRGRLLRFFTWTLITGGIGAILCKASINGGWIPINKNLWSTSFILALSGMAFVFLALLYVVIDVTDLWTGAPFIYPGMNSITIYVCHSVFSQFFPVAWTWPDPTLHWQRLFAALWGTCVWIVLAYYLYLKKIFIAL